MRSDTYQCELCRRYYAECQIKLLHLDFASTPVTLKAVVEEHVAGVRCICDFCIKMIGKLTLCNNNNSECPYCGEINHYIIDSVITIPHDKIIQFKKPCFHCKKIIKYEACWKIQIVAETIYATE